MYSEKDLKEFRKIVSVLLELYKSMSLANAVYCDDFEVERINTQINNISTFLALLDEESLNCLKNFGFDFKKAIGEPLNELCASLILSIIKDK